MHWGDVAWLKPWHGKSNDTLSRPTPLLSTASNNEQNSYLHIGNGKKKVHFYSLTWDKSTHLQIHIKYFSLYIFFPQIQGHNSNITNFGELHFTQWQQSFISDCQAKDERWGQSSAVKTGAGGSPWKSPPGVESRGVIWHPPLPLCTHYTCIIWVENISKMRV